jgi:hypothetical protein
MPRHLSAVAAQMLPLSPISFMHLIGVVEMIVRAIIPAGWLADLWRPSG